MATQSLPGPVVVTHPEHEPLIFYGPPHAVRGTVRLHNPSDEHVRLDVIPVEAPEIRGPSGKPVEVVNLTARLRPREQTILQVEFQVDPATPPGTYDLWMQIAGSRRKALVHITEKAALRLQPNELFFFTAGEQTFQRRFVAENAGNVPLRLAAKCLVLLTDPLELPLALREGLAESREQPWHETVQKVAVALSHQHAGHLTITREDITLKPGEIRVVPVTFHLPPHLQPFRRYQAEWGGYGAGVRIYVYVDEPRVEEPAPRRRRKQ